MLRDGKTCISRCFPTRPRTLPSHVKYERGRHMWKGDTSQGGGGEHVCRAKTYLCWGAVSLGWHRTVLLFLRACMSSGLPGRGSAQGRLWTRTWGQLSLQTVRTESSSRCTSTGPHFPVGRSGVSEISYTDLLDA